MKLLSATAFVTAVGARTVPTVLGWRNFFNCSQPPQHGPANLRVSCLKFHKILQWYLKVKFHSSIWDFVFEVASCYSRLTLFVNMTAVKAFWASGFLQETRCVCVCCACVCVLCMCVCVVCCACVCVLCMCVCVVHVCVCCLVSLVGHTVAEGECWGRYYVQPPGGRKHFLERILWMQCLVKKMHTPKHDAKHSDTVTEIC